MDRETLRLLPSSMHKKMIVTIAALALLNTYWLLRRVREPLGRLLLAYPVDAELDPDPMLSIGCGIVLRELPADLLQVLRQ